MWNRIRVLMALSTACHNLGEAVASVTVVRHVSLPIVPAQFIICDAILGPQRQRGQLTKVCKF